jgi:hypothetical protein
MARDAFAPKADRWHVSGGLKNSRDLPLDRPVVCRRYGTLVPRQVAVACMAAALVVLGCAYVCVLASRKRTKRVLKGPARVALQNRLLE